MPERYRVYWGADPWDGPRSLHEMLRDETDGEIGNDELRFVSDYRMNLVIPSEITDFHKFRTSVGTVLELLKYSKDKKNMEELVQMHQSKGNLEADAVQVINHFSNLKLDVEKKKGEISMWKAWEDQKMEGVMEGRREGALESKIQLVIKKISKGMSVSQIADILEEEEESVQRICDIAAGMAPNYDIVKIREAVSYTHLTLPTNSLV